MLLILMAACALLTGLTGPAFAQEDQPGWRLLLSPPETGQFPQIGFFFEAYDENNIAVADLTADEVTVIENGAALPVDSLERVEPGVQVIAAFNNAPQLANVVGGATYFDRIRLVLRDWALRQPAGTPDDFSIATNSGMLAVRLQEPQQWVKAIEDFLPDLRQSQPSEISFSQALNQLIESGNDPRMKRIILYVTTVPTAAEQEALPNLAESAAQLGARVFVWLVATPDVVNSPAVQPLQQMAALTGGQFFLFTGKEELPDLDVYLNPIRYQYRAAYTSSITQGGAQRLAVQTQRDGLVSTSDEQTFEFTVLPPNPIFLSPPVGILRSWQEPEDGQGEAYLAPQITSIPILIEFPDGYPRPVVRTQLYIDGELQVENTEEPFDVFLWPLAAYTENQRVLLQIRMEDSLGMQGASIETAVQISVQPKETSFIERLLTRRWPLILGIVLLAAMILLSVLYFARRRNVVKEKREKRRAYRDPLTQPVPIRQVDASQTKPPEASTDASRDKISWALSKLKAPARLVRLDAEGKTVRGSTIPLDEDEVIFGRDAKRVTAVIDAPSVSGLHARYFRSADDQYMLADAGSVAGTWINYVPASLEGVSMQHGDLIHFGKATFRFEMSNPPKQNKLKIVPYEDES
ncbi:MAG: FHA domain-containing protein [Anaerolineaceae bacterium]|nr:FHA domain-containing protein [Anaerolineaceae bacterium]